MNNAETRTFRLLQALKEKGWTVDFLQALAHQPLSPGFSDVQVGKVLYVSTKEKTLNFNLQVKVNRPLNRKARRIIQKLGIFELQSVCTFVPMPEGFILFWSCQEPLLFRDSTSLENFVTKIEARFEFGQEMLLPSLHLLRECYVKDPQFRALHPLSLYAFAVHIDEEVVLH